MNLTTCLLALGTSMAVAAGLRADLKNQTLDVYWIDCEGGSATLVVTPAGESVLFDAGAAGGRDAARIVAAVRAVGLARIDYFVLTNIETDHVGGASEVAQLLPFGVVYQGRIPAGSPGSGGQSAAIVERLAAFRGISGKRELLKPGLELPLRPPTNGRPFVLRCLAVDQQFINPADIWAPQNPRAGVARTLPPSDRDNSAVFVLQLGAFRLLFASDLSWNLEAKLISPHNLAGAVDVLQAGWHGAEESNNPALLDATAPRVVVMNNGPRTGADVGTFVAIRSLPEYPAIYQLHRNVFNAPAFNAPDAQTANVREASPPEKCPAHHIQMVVDPLGKTYTISIPANGHTRTYQTR